MKAPDRSEGLPFANKTELKWNHEGQEERKASQKGIFTDLWDI